MKRFGVPADVLRWVGGLINTSIQLLFLTFDPNETAPDAEVNTIMSSAETFAALIISQYNCDFEFTSERPRFYTF